MILEQFSSTLPASNRELIASLVSLMNDGGRVVTQAEYNTWLQTIQDTIGATFKPSFTSTKVEDYKLIASELYNYLLSLIIHDLNNLFKESNAVFDFLYLTMFNHTKRYEDLIAQVNSLYNKYLALYSMRKNGTIWTKGLYTNFLDGSESFIDANSSLKSGVYQDKNGQILSLLDVVPDNDSVFSSNKLVLPGETERVGFRSIDYLWDEDTTVPVKTIKTTSDMSFAVDDDELTFWVDQLCFEKPVTKQLQPYITTVIPKPKEDQFSGEVELFGSNIRGKTRTYFIKFITYGRPGVAQYVCSDDGENYTSFKCKYDTGTQCHFKYTPQYTPDCHNTKCSRYTQYGAITSVATAGEFSPVYTSHGEDSGLGIRFSGPGYFYPGDVYKIHCECSGNAGAVIKLQLETNCVNPVNWFNIQPTINRPFFIDKVEYYDEFHLLHTLKAVPVYCNTSIRFDFSPRVMTKVIITCRQENYTVQTIKTMSDILDHNKLAEAILTQTKAGISDEQLEEEVLNTLPNTYMSSMISQKKSPFFDDTPYCVYEFGFTNIDVGITKYETAGRSVMKGVSVAKLGALKLNTEQSLLNDTYSAVEYTAVAVNYNASDKITSIIEIPMVAFTKYRVSPFIVDYSYQHEYGDVRQHYEHLYLDSAFIAKLRFFCSTDLTVFDTVNQATLTKNTDYTVVLDKTTTPYTTYINLYPYSERTTALLDGQFVVSYTPDTGVYLDKQKMAKLNDNFYVDFSIRRKGADIVKTDVFLVATCRTPEANRDATPQIHRLEFLVGEVDERKYYPEGVANGQFGTRLYTHSASAK